MNTLDLEYKYRVELPVVGVALIPYTLAKKQTIYPEICIWHEEEGEPAVVRAHLCWKCIDWLRGNLAAVSEHWQELEEALAPAGGRAVSSERVTGTGDLFPPLPINGDVSDIMRDIRNAIWSTVGQLVQDRPEVRMPADHGTGVLADWLARWHVEYLAGHPSADHLRAVGKDLVKVVGVMKEAVYQAPTVEVELDASCHQHTVDGTGRKVRCPGRVVAVQTGDGKKVVRCSIDITHRVPADQWFHSHAHRAPRQTRAMNTLKKKYMKTRRE